MATTTKILLRRGTSAEWSTANPVLLLGEVGIDRTLRQMKMGDGTTVWNDLPFLYDSVIAGLDATINMIAKLLAGTGDFKGIVESFSDIATTFPSPANGDIVLVSDENKFYKYSGSEWEALPVAVAGMLTQQQIEDIIDDRYKSFGFAGIGYTIDEFNAYDKPTKITYTDGTVVSNTYNGTVLLNSVYTHSDGSKETVTFNYDAQSRFTGTTVVKS